MFANYRPSTRLARLALFLATAEFLFRALVRTNSNWLSDLAAPYTSTKLWLAGANPYDPLKFFSTWQANGGPNLGLSDLVSGAHSVYPPPTLLLMLPLALLSWTSAVRAFVLLGLLFYAATGYGLIRLGWPQHRRFSDFAQDPMALLFLAFALGLAPVHTAFHSLNIVLFSECAAIFAVLLATSCFAAQSDSSWLAVAGTRKNAVLIGASVCAAILLKPTTGVFLLPWLARERRWRVIAGVLAVCSVLTALSFVPLLAQTGTAWLTDYRHNVTLLFTHGGNADVSPENTENTDRIDLQLVFFALFGDRTAASASAALVYLILLFLFLKQAKVRKPNATHAADLPLLTAAGCLALGLLPSYTRVYAAVVVLPLVLWSFNHLQFSSARWLLLLLSDFLLNTSAIVRRLGEAAGLNAHSPRLWNLTVGGHTCWILLAIGILLPWAVRQQNSEFKEPFDSSFEAAVPVPLG